MNDENEAIELPELSDSAVARIEAGVFAEIEGDAEPARRAGDRSRVRRRRWLTGAGIAAAFVAGVLVTPPILTAVGGSAMSTAGGSSVVSDESAPDTGFSLPSGVTEVAPGSIPGDASTSVESSTSATDAGREIISTANATLRVSDVATAAGEIAALAERHGGYVESTEIGKSVAVDDASAPAPADSTSGWISVRVPSADLSSVMDDLDDSGEVLSSSLSKQDVTTAAVDLRARVDATKASVQRLTELMSQTGSVKDLIDAEVALTERQAQLESYQQQLSALEDQVAMSSLHVQLTRTAPPASADPAGFGDGLLAGWNGLIVALNALVVAFGFLLPWLALAVVITVAVWGIRRARRRRRASHVGAGDSPGSDERS